jgi:hypothetical protein
MPGSNVNHVASVATSGHAVACVLRAYPDLGTYGFGHPAPTLSDGCEFIEQVSAVRAWLQAAPRADRHAAHGSYRVKPLAELESRRYVANGAAIVAAVLEGYTPVRGKLAGPNARFISTLDRHAPEHT